MTLKQNILNLAISLDGYAKDEGLLSVENLDQSTKSFYTGRSSAFKQSAQFIRDHVKLFETVNGEGG